MMFKKWLAWLPWLVLSIGAQATQFLPIDQAFRFSSWADERGVNLTWDITPGHYLYQQNLEVSVERGDGSLGPLEFKTSYKEQYDENFDQVMEVVYDRMAVHVPVFANETVQLKVVYQGCADAGLCYPPTTERVIFSPLSGISPTRPPTPTPAVNAEPDLTQATIPPVITPAPKAKVNTENSQSLASFISNVSLWQAIGLFFLLGVGLTFTPCVLPMIPILSSIIMGQGKISTARAFVLSMTYVLAMALTFALAGLAVAALGARYNLATMMQQPVALITVAIIFVLLALVMFERLSLRLPMQDKLNAWSQRQRGGTFIGVGIMGALSALVVSPCVSAPLAGALIFISATGDMGQGFLALFALGLGMGVPLLIVGTGGSRFMPKAGVWMNRIKAAFGVLLLGVALYLLLRLVDRSLALVAWGVFGVLVLVVAGALEPVAKPWRWLKALAVLALIYCSVLIAGGLAGNTKLLAPLANVATVERAQSKQFVKVDTLAQVEEILASTNQPVMLDYWADWCVSCYVIEEEIFADAEVQEKMSDWLWVQIDVTENNADDQAALEKFGLFGPPAILFFDPEHGYAPELTIQGELSKSAFLEHLGL